MAVVTGGNNTPQIDHTKPGGNYVPALISLAVLYFIMGFLTCLNDTLVPFFKKGFDLSYTSSSLVQFYFFLTYGLMSIPAGRIVQKIGFQRGMVWGFGIAAIGALLFYPASVFHQYSIFLAALFVLAIGIVLLQVAANPYITVLGPPESASSRFTFIQSLGSIGTTVAPLFGAYFILSRLEEAGASSEAVRTPYLFIAGFILLVTFVLSRLKLPVIKMADDDKVSKKGQLKQLFRFRNLKWGVLAIFFYVGAEVAIGTFLTNYISDILKISETEANPYVAYYWGGMLVGRILGGFLLRMVAPQKLLALFSTLSIFCILLSIFSEGNVAVWSMVLVGLFNSIMFAVIFSLAVAGVGSLTTLASGVLSTAIAGGAIISLLFGVLKDNGTWALAFMLPALCYLYILFYGWNGYKKARG